MRFFVTGASGFIGSSLVRELLAGGHDVAVLQRDEALGARIAGLKVTPIRVADSRAGFTSRETAALEGFGPSVVIHAGWIGVGNSARNDREQFQNVDMSLKILTAARDAGARHFVGLGSQAEYGPVEGLISESQRLSPTTLYGAAKSSTFISASVLASQMHMEFSWVRVFSTYGPGDAPYWMISDVATKLLLNEPATLTLGTQLWDYLYVDDAASAIMAVGESAVGLGPVNLGSGSAVPIREIVQKLHDISGSRSDLLFGHVPFRDDQVMHLQADTSKLRLATGWEPRITLDEGLLLTVNAIREGLVDHAV